MAALTGCSPKGKSRGSGKTQGSPNVLFIFPDQMRRYSAGYWSKAPYSRHVVGEADPVVTPNIDRLAERGVVLTQAVANYPLCSPYRGMLLTGCYPERSGIWNNCRDGRNDSLNTAVTNLPEAYRQAGYATAWFGKCHWLKPEPLFDEEHNYVGTRDDPGGHLPNSFDTYVPPGSSRIGIEYFYHLKRNDHFDPITYSSDPALVKGRPDGAAYEPREYNAKLEADAILDYLENSRNQRDPEKPFFAVWSPNPPHNPWVDEHTDMEMYQRYYDTDSFPDRKDLLTRDNVDPEEASHARHYFAAVSSIDHHVGRVIDRLQAIGALDNTIVVFTSDHGEMLGSHGLQGKNSPYLESVAVPFIVHWPDKLRPRLNDDLIFSVPDLMPTLMGLCGLGDRIPSTVQGRDLARLFLDPDSGGIPPPDSSLYLHVRGRGILSKAHTLVLMETGDGRALAESFFYDNLSDPYQLNKVPLEDNPAVARDLLKDLARKLQDSNDPWYQERKHSGLIPYA